MELSKHVYLPGLVQFDLKTSFPYLYTIKSFIAVKVLLRYHLVSENCIFIKAENTKFSFIFIVKCLRIQIIVAWHHFRYVNLFRSRTLIILFR